MNLLTRKEFARLCKLPDKSGSQTIGVAINRDKKVIEIEVLEGDKYVKVIDADDIINKRYRVEKVKVYEDKLKENNSVTDIEPISESIVKRSSKVSKLKVSELKENKLKTKEVVEKSSKESDRVNNLDLRKKQAEVLKIEREAEIKLLDIIKKNGEAIPTDFVIRMFTVLIREMLAKFDSSTIRIAGKFCDIVGADRDLLVRVNDDLNYEMQKIIDEAKKDCKHQINQAIKEYSIQKGKGERELK